MTMQFKKAVRENVGLLVGLIGPSGGGKTMSAMRLAAGISGGKPFAVIDTEARRALHYADRFNFDHAELRPPFRPQAYVDAIAAADKAGYQAIVVDSFSHEWNGDGGILDWQEEEFQRMGAREAVKMASWIKPKMAHKQLVQKLLQVRAHLILCHRAEEKVEMVKVDGKTQIIPKGWQPVCAKDFPYELTASFLLTPDAPGIPKPIKLQEQHKPLFPAGKPIDEDAGKRIAAWAKGGDAPRSSEDPPPEGKGFSWILSNGSAKHFENLIQLKQFVLAGLGKVNEDQAREIQVTNKDSLAVIHAIAPEIAAEIRQAFIAKLGGEDATV